jgi:hypothetical protein
MHSTRNRTYTQTFFRKPYLSCKLETQNWTQTDLCAVGCKRCGTDNILRDSSRIQNIHLLHDASSASYYSETPIYFIMLRMVATLERAWPASSTLIHIEAEQAVGLFAVHIEPGRSATSAVVGVPLRLRHNALRIFGWTSVGTS